MFVGDREAGENLVVLYSIVSTGEAHGVNPNELAVKQADVENRASAASTRALAAGATAFNPKSDAEYIAMVRGGVQRRSRWHERLVRLCGEALQRAGATVSTPHPLDQLMTSPLSVIVEAKTSGSESAGYAIRQAVGQLHEYRYFVGPRDGALCVLVDREPDAELQVYVEDELGMLLLWIREDELRAAPKTRLRLQAAGLRL
jgi:hypothetical protein